MVGEVIREARLAGYHTMLLETETTLKTAQAIYEAAGFEKTDPFYDGPEEIMRR